MDWKALRTLGLNQTEIDCYAALYSQHGISVAELAELLKKPATNLYQPLKNLERKGFISGSKYGGAYKLYFADYLEDALEHLVNYYKQSLYDLILEERAAIKERRRHLERGY